MMDSLLYAYGNYGSWFFIFALLRVIICIGFIVLIIMAIKKLFASPKKTTNPALEILNERFARGEIDVQEYQERKRSLES